MPLWWSDIKTTTARPTYWRFENARLAPSSSIGELPPVLFACKKLFLVLLLLLLLLLLLNYHHLIIIIIITIIIIIINK